MGRPHTTGPSGLRPTERRSEGPSSRGSSRAYRAGATYTPPVRRLLLLGVVVAVLVVGAGLVARSGGGIGADRAAAATATSGATMHGSVGPSAPPLAAVSPSPSLLPSPSPSPSPSPEAPRLPEALLQAALDHWLATTGTPGA